MASIFEPSDVVMSLFYQRFDFTLKTLRSTVRKGLLNAIESRFNLRLLMVQNHLEIG